MGSGEAGAWSRDISSASGDEVEVMERQPCRKAQAVWEFGMRIEKTVQGKYRMGGQLKRANVSTVCNFPQKCEKRKTRTEPWGWLHVMLSVNPHSLFGERSISEGSRESQMWENCGNHRVY